MFPIHPTIIKTKQLLVHEKKTLLTMPLSANTNTYLACY